jgi:hypothetical protein
VEVIVDKPVVVALKMVAGKLMAFDPVLHHVGNGRKDGFEVVLALADGFDLLWALGSIIAKSCAHWELLK